MPSPIPARDNMKESDLQKQIVDYLTILSLQKSDLFFFSIPNEALIMASIIGGLDKKTMSILSMHLKKMGMVPGIPDLCILFHGQAFFVELKKSGKKASETQKRIHIRISLTGHSVIVIDNFEDFRKYIMGIVG